MTAVGEPLDNERLEIYTLDVGQADARLVITKKGEMVLVDADEDEVGEALGTVFEGRDIERDADGSIPIDLFIATHIDQDHVGGLESLRENGYKIDRVAEPANRRYETYTPGVDPPKGRVSEFTLGMYENELDKHGVDMVSQLSTGDSLSPELDLETHVFSPPSEEEEPDKENEEIEFSRHKDGYEVSFESSRANENGAVFKLEDERTALFTGDVQNHTNHHAESWLMEQHDDPESETDLSADMAFIAHHGSDKATSEEFLEREAPDIATISSDFAEEHGHPHDDVLKNLHEHDVETYWTAVHGTIRTDLDNDLTTEYTADTETTNAADLAALKHYCKAHDLAPEEVETLLADELPANTPEWVAEAAPMVAANTEEMVDTAIANAKTLDDARQTLDSYPTATEHCRETTKRDRDEHVTTQADVSENKDAYHTAYRAQAAAQPSRRERIREAVPFVSDPDLPEYDGPAPEDIDGPFTEDALPPGVRDRRTAASIRDNIGDESPPDYLIAAEQQANTAVKKAENTEELCESLRKTPGAHKDVIDAMETSYTVLPRDMVPDGQDRDTTRERTAALSHDKERGMSLKR